MREDILFFFHFWQYTSAVELMKIARMRLPSCFSIYNIPFLYPMFASCPWVRLLSYRVNMIVSRSMEHHPMSDNIFTQPHWFRPCIPVPCVQGHLLACVYPNPWVIWISCGPNLSLLRLEWWKGTQSPCGRRSGSHLVENYEGVHWGEKQGIWFPFRKH